MSATILAGTGSATDTSKAPRRSSPRRGGLPAAIRSNRKALVGAVLLLVFTVLSLAPQLFTSYHDPDAHAFDTGLQPSSSHWLGTTAFGQDIYAQLIYGTRQSLVIAVVVGGLATVLSVLVGVSAAYLGGIPDHVLSAMTDIFLA